MQVKVGPVPLPSKQFWPVIPLHSLPPLVRSRGEATADGERALESSAPCTQAHFQGVRSPAGPLGYTRAYTPSPFDAHNLVPSLPCSFRLSGNALSTCPRPLFVLRFSCSLFSPSVLYFKPTSHCVHTSTILRSGSLEPTSSSPSPSFPHLASRIVIPDKISHILQSSPHYILSEASLQISSHTSTTPTTLLPSTVITLGRSGARCCLNFRFLDIYVRATCHLPDPFL